MTSMTSAPLPDADEILRHAHVVQLPMRTRFRGQSTREVMLIHGPAGWAEFGPFPEYEPAEASAWLAGALEAGWSGLGRGLRTEIPVNATVPAVAADQVPRVLAHYGDGVSVVKIKVAEQGQSIQDDAARVSAVRRALPEAALRVDANGGWTVEEAVPALAAILDAAGGELEYAEQPVPGVEGLADLREALARAAVPVRIAADEAVRKAADPLRVARMGAADLVVIKAAPLGGVSRALQVVEQSGLPAVVSSALDSSVGLTAGLALAARLPELPFACGLGTVSLFTSDVVPVPLVAHKGMLRVPTVHAQTITAMPGLHPAPPGTITAPAPDPQLMATHRAPAERTAWWHQRVRDAHAVLAAA